MTFGVFAVISGLRQIIYGKRNQVLTFIVLILGIGFIGIKLPTIFTKR